MTDNVDSINRKRRHDSMLSRHPRYDLTRFVRAMHHCGDIYALDIACCDVSHTAPGGVTASMASMTMSVDRNATRYAAQKALAEARKGVPCKLDDETSKTATGLQTLTTGPL